MAETESYQSSLRTCGFESCLHDICEYSNEPFGSIKGGGFLTTWVTINFQGTPCSVDLVAPVLYDQNIISCSVVRA
jgi:hypothetical protein